MQELIKPINTLQVIISQSKADLKIDLPRIVVVGSQSSGKSSVLESIVGHDFLPKGAGMVTRCPLFLQLIQTKTGEDYAIFPTRSKEIKFANFDEVKEEIIKITGDITGGVKGVSNSPIIMEVHSQKVPPLTLVDLPGLIRVPDKDQPEDTGDKILEMVIKEIKQENCLILAVSPGNMDLATSDALCLAKKVDPKGDRTLGVITKLDLMDKDTDALSILKGREFPLKLGYVGVVCRSQQDVNLKKTLEDSVKSENQFFASSSIYAPIKERCGTQYLSKRLSELLYTHVKACLPKLHKVIDTRIEEIKEELTVYGEKDKRSPPVILMELVKKFADSYGEAFECEETKGDYAKHIYKLTLEEGARIHRIMHEIFPEGLRKMEVLDGLSSEYIVTTIENFKALKFCMFVPDEAVEMLIKNQIQKFETPIRLCSKAVYAEVEKFVQEMAVPNLDHYKLLKAKILDFALKYLEKLAKNTEREAVHILLLESTFINSEDRAIWSFEETMFRIAAQEIQKRISGVNTNTSTANVVSVINSLIPTVFGLQDASLIKPIEIKKVEERKEEAKEVRELPYLELTRPLPKDLRPVLGTLSMREEMKLSAIATFMTGYLERVKSKLIDLIPKCIMKHFIQISRTEMFEQLSAKLFENRETEQLVTENMDIVYKREECIKILQLLTDAKGELNVLSSY